MLTRAFNEKDEWISISEVTKLPPRQRPPCICPACRHPLVAKGGEVKAHHFAHRPEESGCYAAGGEGLEHLEAKLQLLEHLDACILAGETVQGLCKCPCCSGQYEAQLYRPEPGDKVRAEHWLDPEKTIKPDLTVWRDDRCVAVFEVVVSHPCSTAKWAQLAAQGAPAVEVPAGGAPGREGRAGDGQVRVERGLGIERFCPPCAERLEETLRYFSDVVGGTEDLELEVTCEACGERGTSLAYKPSPSDRLEVEGARHIDERLLLKVMRANLTVLVVELHLVGDGGPSSIPEGSFSGFSLALRYLTGSHLGPKPRPKLPATGPFGLATCCLRCIGPRLELAERLNHHVASSTPLEVQAPCGQCRNHFPVTLLRPEPGDRVSLQVPPAPDKPDVRVVRGSICALAANVTGDLLKPARPGGFSRPWMGNVAADFQVASVRLPELLPAKLGYTRVCPDCLSRRPPVPTKAEAPPAPATLKASSPSKPKSPSTPPKERALGHVAAYSIVDHHLPDGRTFRYRFILGRLKVGEKWVRAELQVDCDPSGGGTWQYRSLEAEWGEDVAGDGQRLLDECRAAAARWKAIRRSQGVVETHFGIRRVEPPSPGADLEYPPHAWTWDTQTRSWKSKPEEPPART